MTSIVSRQASRRPPLRGTTAVGVFALLALLGCGAWTPEGETRGDAPEPDAGRPPLNEAPAAGVGDPDSRAWRIVFLGDSISAGYGLAEAEAFPAIVEADLRDRGLAVEIVNAGVSGDTSAGGLSRIDWVLRGGADLLVVELGANDALRGQPLAATEGNLRAIVERARASGARVLLLGMDVPTNYGPEYAGGFSKLYARLAEELDVPFVPGFIREVGLDPDLMQPDGLHPTAAGHRRLAEILRPHLVALIEEKPG